MKSGNQFLGLVGIAFATLVVYRVAPCGAITMTGVFLTILVLLSSPFRRR